MDNEEPPVHNPYIKLDKVDIYSCSICTRGFLDNDSVILHKEQCSEAERALDEQDGSSSESTLQSLSTADNDYGDMEEQLLSPYVKLDRIKIYECNICTRGFLDHYAFKMHKKQYLAMTRPPENNNNIEKPYKCELCCTRFAAKSTLEAHSTIHKPFPYECECGVGYYKKCDLYSHRTLVHSEKLNPKDDQINLELKYDEEDSDLDTFNTKTIRPKLKAELSYQAKKSSLDKIMNQTLKAQIEELGIEKDVYGKYTCSKCPETFTNPKTAVSHVIGHKNRVSCDICSAVVNEQNMRHHKAKVHNIITPKPSNKFICTHCGKKLCSKNGLIIHTRTHTGEKPFACKMCPMSFAQSGALQIHMNVHLGIKNFKCDYCDKSFVSKAARALHHRTHTKVKPYECKICGKMFGDPSAYARHIVLHTGLKPHHCRLCPKAFSDRSALRIHERRHTGFTASCPICHKVLSSMDQVKKHVKTVHENIEKKFECDLCGKKFSYKYNLMIHMQNKRNHVYVCESCNIEFKTKNCLREHCVEVHEMIGYECDYCGYIARRKDLLRAHIDVQHMKTKEYECKIFQRKFNDIKYNKRHSNKHHASRKCGLCRRLFSSSYKLERHKAEGCVQCHVCLKTFQHRSYKEKHYISQHMHRKDKNTYNCDHCMKVYSDRSTLATHMTIDHGDLQLTCDHCQQMFRNKAGLRDHIWDRHMLSLFCACGKRFYNDSDFGSHKSSGCGAKTKPIKQG